MNPKKRKKNRHILTVTARVAISYGALFFILFQSQAQTPDSLDVKIGQMILIGLPKAEVDSSVLEKIRLGKAGAIILFEKNIPKTNSFAGLKKIIWTYQKAAPMPLLIGIDQEGGRVNRLKEKYGFPRSISAAAMGKARMLDSVRFYGESTAATLAGLGININFAPVVDLAINPDNTVIVKVERSFSAQEDTVIMMAKEFIKQHRKYRVATVLKHFPGHGSSKEDTHYGIADVTNTWNERELRPYAALMDSGYVDAIMTAHIVNRKLDKRGYPGTLSELVMDSLLRKKLGFRGVIISDDMGMHAISKQYGLEESIKKCINAGVDILCFSNNIATTEERPVDKVHGIIRDLVEKGEIPRNRIDESFKRVMKLKASLNSEAASDLQKELRMAEIQITRLKEENELLRNQVSQKDEKTTTEKSSKRKKKDKLK